MFSKHRLKKSKIYHFEDSLQNDLVITERKGEKKKIKSAYEIN